MSQTLADIKALLDRHGLRPKHQHGQNFLIDGNHLRRIVEAARSLSEHDSGGPSPQPSPKGTGSERAWRVLEVGPGTGVLTEAMLEAGADVIAVEIDTDLVDVLRDRLDGAIDGGRLAIVQGDVLAGKRAIAPAVNEAMAERWGGGAPFTLVANLPYHVASPLIANLVVDDLAMRGAVVMVQKEVADRLAAEPGGKDYGALGVVVQAGCAVERVSVLGPGCFWPAPKVASAVVKLTRRAEPIGGDLGRVSRFAGELFRSRRKQLGGVFRSAGWRWGADGEAGWPAGVESTVRAERLTVSQIAALAAWVEGRWNSPAGSGIDPTPGVP
ncbi:MAG: 16S rRNA (adenine(1518)-N(6)/adenine(1519)-N(6))-dimethyltransferase RsmA [Planctomycetota bacterium]